MSIFVFTGPTITEAEAKQWLDAVYLPPVSQGDIINLLRQEPKVIGIIDGYFDSVPAVWHKEILLALSEGVCVVGGASMGALRAAELHSFGMIGIGEIFEWYRDGVIDADDEVAVHHAPAEYGYKPLSEPMVNIRKTLQAACEEGSISQNTLEQLIIIGRETSYWERSYTRLLNKGRELGISEGEIRRLQDFIEDKTIDLKQQDAIELLRYISSRPENSLPTPTFFELQETVYLARLIDRDRTVRELNGIQLTADELVNHARLELDGFLALKERATMNTLIINFAKHLGLAVSDEEMKKEVVEIFRSLGLSTEEEIGVWRAQNDLAENEFEQMIAEFALIKKMKRIYPSSLSNYEMLRQLRIEGKYERMVHTAIEKNLILSGKRLPSDESLSNLYASYFAHKGLDVPEDIYEYAAELGFQDYASFVLEIEKNYRYHKHISDSHR